MNSRCVPPGYSSSGSAITASQKRTADQAALCAPSSAPSPGGRNRLISAGIGWPNITTVATSNAARATAFPSQRGLISATTAWTPSRHGSGPRARPRSTSRGGSCRGSEQAFRSRLGGWPSTRPRSRSLRPVPASRAEDRRSEHGDGGKPPRRRRDLKRASGAPRIEDLDRPWR